MKIITHLNLFHLLGQKKKITASRIQFVYHYVIYFLFTGTEARVMCKYLLYDPTMFPQSTKLTPKLNANHIV